LFGLVHGHGLSPLLWCISCGVRQVRRIGPSRDQHSVDADHLGDDADQDVVATLRRYRSHAKQEQPAAFLFSECFLDHIALPKASSVHSIIYPPLVGPPQPYFLRRIKGRPARWRPPGARLFDPPRGSREKWRNSAVFFVICDQVSPWAFHGEGAEATQLDALAASQSGGWARSGPIGEKRGNPSDYAIAWLTASHIAPYTLHSAGDCATRLLGNSPNEATTYTWRVATEGRKG
jgi:hypothetical protein